jgi:hypothetical protein
MDIHQHKEIHSMLHKKLDELVADYITHCEILPSKTSIMELMQWSYQQTLNPTVKEGQ